MKRKPWKEFEQAVEKFIAALDPKAKVTGDVRTPDSETGRPRQRDVWVETKVLGHFALKILISCKRWKRRLSQGDLDAFRGELISSNCQLGVLYSYSGFSKPAVEKAKKLGICCCRLYENQSADIPESIFLRAYCFCPVFSIALGGEPAESWNLKTWNDLFSMTLEKRNNAPVIDYLDNEFRANQDKYSKPPAGSLFPQAWSQETVIKDAEGNILKIIVQGAWKVYEGKLNAYLLKGSYSFTNKDFVGRQALPFVDLRGPTPGEGWELVDHPPPGISGPTAVMILFGGSIKDNLVKEMGLKSISTPM